MPDERVQAAIKNWAPRFITQGVDYNDFFRTTARIERWDDWCYEWCATGDLHAELATRAQEKGNSVSAGQAWVAAALAYHFAKFLFQDHPDEYKEAAQDSIDAYARGLALLDPSAERIEIPFEDGAMVGILRRPQGLERPPLVLLLPGLDSTKEEFFHWEEVFLARGLATFTLEGPGQGECGFQLSMRPDYEAPVSVALNTLVRRPDIDADRMGVAGVSLGGYYAVRAAAFEPRIRAVVGNGGPWNWRECWEGLPALTRNAFQHHAGARDEQEARALAARFSLEHAADKIRQPLLIIHGRLDRIVPWEQGQKIVNAVGGNAEFALFENGNHVCNNIPYVYRPLTADWLKEKLG